MPSLVYVSRERMVFDPYLHNAPDLAIEILPPDSPIVRLVDKVQFYLLYGVRLVWVVDPELQEIAVLKPGEEGQMLGPGDTLDGGNVLPGFSVHVAEIFAEAQV